MITFSVTPHDHGFAVCAQGKPLLTPQKRPLALPTRALAEAIAPEWVQSPRFQPQRMPLTTLAYTAIDRIAGQEESIVEALLLYVDTDTLCYRASASETLRQRQEREWGGVLAWAGDALGQRWAITSGVMPIEQSPKLHAAVAARLRGYAPMPLAAACMLASGFSSLALMLAVMEKHLDAQQAFDLSRLEENAQAEQWGRDREAQARAERLKEEILHAERFLRLLETV